MSSRAEELHLRALPACFADGIAIATHASVGQRTLTIAPEKAPVGDAAVIVIRPRKGGPGFKYTIPMSALAKLGLMNKNLDERGRYDAVMATDGLFLVEPTRESGQANLKGGNSGSDPNQTLAGSESRSAAGP